MLLKQPRYAENAEGDMHMLDAKCKSEEEGKGEGEGGEGGRWEGERICLLFSPSCPTNENDKLGYCISRSRFAGPLKIGQPGG